MKHFTMSDRGERYNFLIYPFLLSTLSYGIGFALFGSTKAVVKSSLHVAMTDMITWLPAAWGTMCILVILLGAYLLLFDIPPIARANAMTGFILWCFGAWCYFWDGGYLPLAAVALPNIVFWAWQFISVSRFREEEVKDARKISLKWKRKLL